MREQQWQTAFGRLSYGIYVLTTRVDDAVNGMIASWVTQVSYEPPLIMAAVHPNRYSHDMIGKGGAFGLHIIDRSQKGLLKRFKGPDPAEKFTGMNWRPGETGVPILIDCLAWFELTVVEQHCPGNHTLFVGKVVDAGVYAEGVPLTTLDYEGVYIGKA